MMPEPRAPAPAGTVDELREVAAEQLALTAFHSTLAVDQFSVLADAGALYNARRAVAHIRHAVATMKLMEEALAKAATEAEQRRAERGLNGRQRRGERA